MKINTLLLTLLSCFVVFSCSEKKEEKQQNQESTKKSKAKPVETMTLKKQPFTHKFSVTGIVSTNMNIIIRPEASGKIDAVFIKEGQKVTKGKLLVKINSSALTNSLKNLEIQYNLAKVSFEKVEKLWVNEKIGSEIDYLKSKQVKESLGAQIKSTKAQISMANITAPFSGYVDDLFLHKGELASPNSPLLRLVNTDEIYIYADISENYLNKIKKGSKAEVSFPNLDESYNQSSKISFVSNTIDKNNRTYKVKVPINNKNNMIKPNLMTTVFFTDYEKADAFVIPTKILKNDNKGYFIFTVKNNIAEKTYINLQFNDGGASTEINSKSLVSGVKIVIRGDNNLSDGSSVKEVN